jgi:hypothetical protein
VLIRKICVSTTIKKSERTLKSWKTFHRQRFHSTTSLTWSLPFMLEHFRYRLRFMFVIVVMIGMIIP